MAYEIAHIVLVPFLWMNGYDTNSESIATAHDAIEVQRREAEKEDIGFFRFFQNANGSVPSTRADQLTHNDLEKACHQQTPPKSDQMGVTFFHRNQKGKDF